MSYWNDSLSHHGIQGQKWGVRRFQNDDGSLTEEGRARYGHLKDRGDTGILKKRTLGSEMGNYAFAKWRERRHKKNLEKMKKVDKDIEKNEKLRKLYSEDEWKDFKKLVKNDQSKQVKKYQSKLDAQSAANRNLDAYRRHSSTAKLIMQNMVPIGGSLYRHARARGESRLSSLVEGLTPIGPILRMARDKKAYGKHIVFGNTDGEAL